MIHTIHDKEIDGFVESEIKSSFCTIVISCDDVLKLSPRKNVQTIIKFFIQIFS